MSYLIAVEGEMVVEDSSALCFMTRSLTSSYRSDMK